MSGVPVVQSALQSMQNPATPASGSSSGFADTLRSAVQQVEQMQQDAQQKTTALFSGDGQDVHAAMIAVEKADLSFQMMMQVRNKIVAAYQEVSRMSF